MTPGVKPRPIRPASLAALRSMARQPQPRQEFNPGVEDRLKREALVESVDLPSPYAKHKGAPIEHLRPTAAGLDLLKSI